jgi:hypothetical protein
MLTDREIAYEQNVTGLETAWADRIASFATEAVEQLASTCGDDVDGLRLEATEVVAARLLNSDRWANVKATDVSDIAYEAVDREIASRR